MLRLLAIAVLLTSTHAYAQTPEVYSGQSKRQDSSDCNGGQRYRDITLTVTGTEVAYGSEQKLRSVLNPDGSFVIKDGSFSMEGVLARDRTSIAGKYQFLNQRGRVGSICYFSFTISRK